MPPKISKPGGKDLKAVRPAEVRKIQEEKKAVARPLAVVTADNALSNTASAAASMCNHQKYGVKADLWEWTVQLCEGGEIKVVWQDQPGRPGITVKRITTTVIRARIKNDFVASQNGSIYRLIGKMWRPDISNKFSQKLTKAFQNGFPEDWMKIGKEEWLQRQEIMRARHQDSLQLDQLKPSRPLALPLPPSTPARLFGSFPPADEIPSPAWEVEGEENSDRLSDEFNHKRRKTSPSPTIQVEPPTQLTEPVALDLAIVRNEPANPDQVAGKREVEVELAENEEEEAVVESGEKEPSGKFADAASHSDLLSEDDPQSEKKGDSEIPQDGVDAEMIHVAPPSAFKDKPSTSLASADTTVATLKPQPEYELRRRDGVCYNYRWGAQKESRKSQLKSQEKLKKTSRDSLGKVSPPVKVVEEASAKKRKSDTEQSDPDDAGKNDESPKKRTRPSTPFVAATTSRSPDRKASVSERQEEEYLSGLDDSMDMERMTRSQHNEVYAVSQKDSNSRKSTPHKVVLSSYKSPRKSSPARISMSAPAITKKKSVIKKKKTLEEILAAEKDKIVRKLSPKVTELPKKTREGTPLFKYLKADQVIVDKAEKEIPQVHFEESDEFVDEEVVKPRKKAGKKAKAAMVFEESDGFGDEETVKPRKKAGKKAKAAMVGRGKKAKVVVAQTEEEFPSILNAHSTDVNEKKKKKGEKSARSWIASPEISQEASAIKPRVTRPRSVKEPPKPPKTVKKTSGAAKKAKPVKRRSIVPVKRTAKWFEEVVEAGMEVVTSPSKKKAAVSVLFKNRESTSRKSVKLSLGTVDWEDDDEDDVLPDFKAIQPLQTNKTFRMSMGKLTRRPTPRRDTCYEPSNAADAVRRLNFQGFMEKEKADKAGGGRGGLKRHRNMADLSEMSPAQRFEMPPPSPQFPERDWTEEEPDSDDD